MPDVIRLAVPHMYGNRTGLMTTEPLIRTGQRYEVDIMESDYNNNEKESNAGRVSKLASYGGAIASAVMIDCFSGYTTIKPVSSLANSMKYMEVLVSQATREGANPSLLLQMLV